MSKISLKYGEGVLDLTKSEKTIAVKLTPEADAAARASFGALPSPRGPEALGGFRLIDVESLPARTKDTLDRLRARGALVTRTQVYETSDDGVPFVPTGQIYLEFDETATDDELQQIIDEHRLEIVEARGAREFILQVTSSTADPVETATALQQSKAVKVAEPDLATPGVLKGFALPADDLLREQWHLRNTGKHRGTPVGFKQGADARVIDAWEHARTLGSPDVVVAVIDDGFDLEHLDLCGPGKIVAPADFSRNGHHPVPDPLGGDWHGTACAGVAVGNANGSGVVGAAPGCRLMPVRWGPDLSDTQIEKWFGWVTAQGASVVSCSWGAAAKVFPLSTRARRAIARCARRGRGGLGCVIVFAAGNENHNINDPPRSLDGFATHPDVIAVAACNSRDEKSSYSNYGREISVCAPSSGAGGWGITTTDVRGRFQRNGVWFEAGYSPGDYTHDFGGTSSACPLVAGICALLLSIKPQMTARQVRDVIQRSARRIGDPKLYSENERSVYYGHGCIDALNAVKALEA
ncbi:S8 family peptidase [Sorangium sp. So ce131]|uniref:S8 family peptidase n=1 Tax=Sorangium sp. So ce131 TaxID=3133282 RepID=UPI003F607C58